MKLSYFLAYFYFLFPHLGLFVCFLQMQWPFHTSEMNKPQVENANSNQDSREHNSISI